MLIFLWGAATPAQEIQHQAIAVNIEVPVRVYKSGENELASATGGLTGSSSNAEKAFQKAVKASQIYYLVYYKPKQYAADNRFHKIEVRIKGGGYRVLHRAGYAAD